jgi:hypothetical protein
VLRLVAPLLISSFAIAVAAPPSSVGNQTTSGVEKLALQWFDEMRTGQIDRDQLSAEYSAQLTDTAISGMARYLQEYKYGVSPLGAEILQSRTVGEQTFYVVKLVFPRGDAASLMMGFNRDGKITGISLMSMAGD